MYLIFFYKPQQIVTLGIIINETKLTTVLCAYTSFPTDFFYMYDINTIYFNLQHHIHLQKTWVCNYENLQQTLKLNIRIPLIV